jgi:two-component system sensor histidine kinase CpxA
VVEAFREGERVLLTISDQGPGVSAQELEKLFDPFYRVDPSRTSETGGVGLGLAIVKSCVEACGGTVNASNRAPRGLEVRIRLLRA